MLAEAQEEGKCLTDLFVYLHHVYKSVFLSVNESLKL